MKTACTLFAVPFLFGTIPTASGFLAEIHIFQAGKHGFREKGGGADHYLDRLQEWMKVNGWLSKDP